MVCVCVCAAAVSEVWESAAVFEIEIMVKLWGLPYASRPAERGIVIPAHSMVCLVGGAACPAESLQNSYCGTPGGGGVNSGAVLGGTRLKPQAHSACWQHCYLS
jgi:hypothetical protein